MAAEIANEFKPKMTHDEFITQLREAGFTEKTLAVLDEEDINSDAALRILSADDVETLAKEKGLTIGQKRLLIEFAAKLNPKKKESSEQSRAAPRSSHPASIRGRAHGYGDGVVSKPDRSRSPATQQKRMNPDESACLCVFNLSPHTSEQYIYEFFSRIAHVKNVKIVYDKMTGYSRGFGFVYFMDIQTAKYAKEAAQGMVIDNQQIRIDFSLTTRSGPSGF